MKKISVLMFLCLIPTVLVGCDDKLDQLKEAVSGIDDQADKAAKAISSDAHSIRSVEINYENNTFTINELFKTILRDTLWEYEKNDTKHVLNIKGTWKEPLFEKYDFPDDKEQLKETGKVFVELQVENGKINEEKTNVIFQNKDNIILEIKGKEALVELYDTYIKSTTNS